MRTDGGKEKGNRGTLETPHAAMKPYKPHDMSMSAFKALASTRRLRKLGLVTEIVTLFGLLVTTAVFASLYFTRR